MQRHWVMKSDKGVHAHVLKSAPDEMRQGKSLRTVSQKNKNKDQDIWHM